MAKKSKGLYSKVEHEPIHHKTSIGRNPSKTKMNKIDELNARLKFELLYILLFTELLLVIM